jgi:hypothetical protein
MRGRGRGFNSYRGGEYFPYPTPSTWELPPKSADGNFLGSTLSNNPDTKMLEAKPEIVVSDEEETDAQAPDDVVAYRRTVMQVSI